jgi:hypothetical protein
MIIRLIVAIALITVFSAGTPKYGYADLPVSEPVEIDLAGKKAFLQLALLKGGKVRDEALSAMCAERIEGTFAVKVKFRKGRTVSTSINDLMKFTKVRSAKLAFCATHWRIVTADYNRDGHIDFNLGQYGTSNGWVYWLFTVSPSGHISLLPVPDDFIFLADNKNSTAEIKVSDEGIKSVAYANTCDKVEDCGWWETTYRWNSELGRFEQHDSRHLEEYLPRMNR